MLKYICGAFPEKVPETMYPKDLQKRAEVDRFLEWNQYHMRAAMVVNLHAQLKMRPEMASMAEETKKMLFNQSVNMLKLLN